MRGVVSEEGPEEAIAVDGEGRGPSAPFRGRFAVSVGVCEFIFFFRWWHRAWMLAQQLSEGRGRVDAGV